MADGTTIKWDLARWARHWSTVKKGSGEAAQTFVLDQSRRLLRALAWFTPRAPYYKLQRVWKITDRAGRKRYIPLQEPQFIRVAAGRARAGWWPAASLLGVSSVYTRWKNQGEGSIVDGSRDTGAPRIVMTNSVPYILLIRGHGNWAQEALNQESANLTRRIEDAYRQRLTGYVR